jgi:hypothetical protein
MQLTKDKAKISVSCYLLKESAKIVPNDEVRTKKRKLPEDNLKISASFKFSAKGV